MKKIIIVFLLSFFTLAINAQEVKMADTMRENGKIYVVIAIILTILLGIALYLVRLDRKISKLENNK